MREPYILEMTNLQMFSGYLLCVGCKMVRLASFIVVIKNLDSPSNKCLEIECEPLLMKCTLKCIRLLMQLVTKNLS